MDLRGTRWKILDWVYLAQFSNNCRGGGFRTGSHLRVSMKCWEFHDEMLSCKLLNNVSGL